MCCIWNLLCILSECERPTRPWLSLFQVVWANDQCCHLFQEALLDTVQHLFSHAPVKTTKFHLMVGVWIPDISQSGPRRERKIIQPWKMVIVCILSYVSYIQGQVFSLISFLCKTKENWLHVRTKHHWMCLLLKRPPLDCSTKMKSKTDVVSVNVGLNGATCYKVPVCLCCQVQTRGCWDKKNPMCIS